MPSRRSSQSPPATRSIRYQQIAAALRALVTSSGAGQVLPSESELSARYAASRVTVRRALEVLRAEGLIDSRQGFGWFVAGEPFQQRLGRLETIEQQLLSGGLRPEREIREFAFVEAAAGVAARLGTRHVLRVKRRNLADGQPFAVVTVWCPADLGQHLSRRDVERQPFYELLGVELRGAVQTIGADAATDDDASLLAVPSGSPILRCERLTTTIDGRPVLLSEHRFAAHRTEFVVDLPNAGPSIVPSGLRLVD